MRSASLIIISLSLLLASSVSALAINANFDKFEAQDKQYVIPDWVKHNADWWVQGYISDAEFSYSIEYLVNNGFIIIEDCQGGRCIEIIESGD